MQLWEAGHDPGLHVQRGRQPRRSTRPRREEAPPGRQLRLALAPTRVRSGAGPILRPMEPAAAPVLREGLKVQTPWVTAFLKDPYPIRPAVDLRMPRVPFRLRTTTRSRGGNDRARELLRSRRGRGLPLTSTSPSATETTWPRRKAKHTDYLGSGLEAMTKGACVNCHAIGQFKPTGGAQVGQRTRPAASSDPGSRPGISKNGWRTRNGCFPLRRCRRTSRREAPPSFRPNRRSRSRITRVDLVKSVARWRF